MPSQTKTTSVLLWIAQALLAALFVFAGVVKLTMPLAPVARVTGLPVAFLQFIAAVEILGAVGLVLPGLLRIGLALTPLAAIGLVGVMTGAVVVTVSSQGVEPALLPAIVGVLLVAVIRCRRQWVERPEAIRLASQDPTAISQVTKRAA